MSDADDINDPCWADRADTWMYWVRVLISLASTLKRDTRKYHVKNRESKSEESVLAHKMSWILDRRGGKKITWSFTTWIAQTLFYWSEWVWFEKRFTVRGTRERLLPPQRSVPLLPRCGARSLSGTMYMHLGLFTSILLAGWQARLTAGEEHRRLASILSLKDFGATTSTLPSVGEFVVLLSPKINT